MAMLEVKKLSKSFDTLTVLRDISFTVEKGEVVAVIGPSGSGKSTLLRCINQLEKASGGSITVCGMTLMNTNEHGKAVYSDSKTLRQIRLKTGLVFQNFNLFPHMSVLRNITEAPLRVLKQDKTKVRENAVSLLKKMGLDSKADAYPSELSGGQQQRVAIARALMNEPPVLFADEPTGNLDTKSSIEIMNLFTELSNEGITIVMVTHEDDIAAYAKRHLVMRDGKLIKDDRK